LLPSITHAHHAGVILILPCDSHVDFQASKGVAGTTLAASPHRLEIGAFAKE
jgi:hypothetical protein